MRAFWSPKPGSALSRLSTVAPSGSPSVHRRVTSPSYCSTRAAATPWMRPAIEPG